MKTAKELFEELGYEATTDNDEYKIFNRDDKYIEITKCNSKVDDNVYIDVYVYDYVKEERKFTCIDGKELQAINQMCRELGWLDD